MSRKRASTPYLLIAGLLLAVGLLVLPACDSPQNTDPGRGGSGSVKVIELTNDNWQQEVMESKIPVMVDFTAEWCGPCQAFAPTVQKLANRYEGKIKVCKFDVGDQSFNKGKKLAAEYGIRGVPTILIFKDGELHKAFTGGRSEAEFARAFNEVLQ